MMMIMTMMMMKKERVITGVDVDVGFSRCESGPSLSFLIFGSPLREQKSLF